MVGAVVFVLDRWPVLEAAVEPVGVVPGEPLEHGGAGFGAGGEVFEEPFSEHSYDFKDV